MAAKLKVLAIAAATGRIGYVFLKGEKLRDWGMSRKASKSPKLAASQVQKWIDYLKPDVVVTEDVPKTSTKGAKTKALIKALAAVAKRANVLDVAVKRYSAFRNKYEEATFFGQQFPEIRPWVPKKRKIWESEPRNMIYFEALSIAVQVLNGAE